MTTPAPSLLAFDTATETLSVALCRGTEQWAWNGSGGAQASAQLVPQCLALLQRAGLGLSQLQAIAFGAGPGAFTGLRTACAVAQGLALGAGVPVLALDSLLLVAEDARLQADLPAQGALDVDVAMDARMGEIYAAAYHWDGRRWHTARRPELTGCDALNAQWQAQPPLCIAGSALDAFAARLHTGAARCLPLVRDRAAALLPLALQAWHEGRATDPAEALPLYLRDKVAQTTAERESARAIKAPLS